MFASDFRCPRGAVAGLRLVLGLLCVWGVFPSIASAQGSPTVERDGSVITAIRNLEVSGVVYDVQFCTLTTAAIYEDPPRFDFTTLLDAQIAMTAVVAVINAEGGILLAGDANCGTDSLFSPIFRIGFGIIDEVIEIDAFFLDLDIPVKLTTCWEGVNQEPDTTSDVWVIPTDSDVFPTLLAGTWAKFTRVDTTGSGNMPPVAEAAGPYEGAVGIAVDFDGTASSDPDGMITAFDWDFGDNMSGTGATVSHTYSGENNYNVTLTVTDNDGSSSSDVAQANIGAASQPPVAVAGGPYTGTVQRTIQVDASASSDADGTVDVYSWDWDDGLTTVSVVPTTGHSYMDPGTYMVLLTVTDDSGEIGTDITEIVVGVGNIPPEASAGLPVMGVAGMEVSFDGTGSIDPDGDMLAYEWDFGDGMIGSGESPTHTYMGADNYLVTLVVTDDGGAADSSATVAAIALTNLHPLAEANGPYSGSVGVDVDFDGTGSSDPDGTILCMHWDFGDDTNGTGETPSHAYMAAGNYSVTLTVIDDDGAFTKDFSSADIGGDNQSPVAKINGPYAGTVGVPVTFNASGSSDPDGYIVAFAWDFGDGSPPGNGELPTHTYDAEGTYSVVLTATDDRGAVDFNGTDAVIAAVGGPSAAEGSGSVPPTADAGGPYTGSITTPVEFDGTDSSDPDGPIDTYTWDFGDNTTGAGATPIHTYAVGGNYNVTLTVTDGAGLPASDAAVAVIGAASLPPTADAGGPYNGTIGAPEKFDGTNSSDEDGFIATYDWDFGDGMTSGPGGSPTHTYDAGGNYVVTLTVTDDSGETDSTATKATIGSGNSPPMADDGGPYSGTIGFGESVNFDGGRSNDEDGTIASYEWEFGDGMTASGATTSHAYAAPGVYFVTLKTTDDIGSVDSAGTLAAVLDDIDGDGVLNVDDKDNDNDKFKDNKDVDKDGDGWDVTLETAAGSSDLDPFSLPLSGSSGDAGPGTKKVVVKLNRKKPDQDSIAINGTVVVSEGFDPAGAEVSFEFGDGALVKEYTLDTKGKFTDKPLGEKVSFGKAKRLKESDTYVSTFSINLKKQDLADVLPQFDDATVKKVMRPFTFAVTLEGTIWTNQKSMEYTATEGKNGNAKQPKAPKPPKN
jgi:PKD repeat protein